MPHLLFERRDEGSALGFPQYPFRALETRRTHSETLLHVCLCVLVYTHVCGAFGVNLTTTTLAPSESLKPESSVAGGAATDISQ